MPRIDNAVNLKAELCRAKCKLNDVEEQLRFAQRSGEEQLRFVQRSGEERYNGLYKKFEQNSVKLDANEHELKTLSTQLRLKEVELERVKNELIQERQRVNMLTVQIQEMGNGSGPYPRSERSSGGNSEYSSSRSSSTRRYAQGSADTSSSMDSQTPQQTRPLNGNMFLGLSDIYPPTDASTERLVIGPPNFNTSTPTTPANHEQVTSRLDTGHPNRQQPTANNYFAKTSCVESIGETLKRMTFIKFKSPLPENASKRPRTENSVKEPERDETLDTTEEEETNHLMSTTVVRDQSSWIVPTTEYADYVLIRLSPAKPNKKGLKGPGKNKDKYFVAKVTGGRISGGVKLCRVEYLSKKSGQSGPYFVSKPNKDEFEVEPEQIVKSLPCPELGRRGVVSFPGFAFDQYAMGL